MSNVEQTPDRLRANTAETGSNRPGGFIYLSSITQKEEQKQQDVIAILHMAVKNLV